MRRIETADDLAEGAAWLCAREPRFAPLLARVGPLPLRRATPGFGYMIEAVVSQQVSLASARAIGGRLKEAGITTEAAVIAAGAEGLRACGLSRPKIASLLALAGAGVDWAGLDARPDDDLVRHLDALPGIGRWTAELYGLTALGRPDLFPAGDLALQKAAAHLFDLPDRPDERTLRALAEPWSPWRAVAARALWAYIRIISGREGGGT